MQRSILVVLVSVTLSALVTTLLLLVQAPGGGGGGAARVVDGPVSLSDSVSRTELARLEERLEGLVLEVEALRAGARAERVPATEVGDSADGERWGELLAAMSAEPAASHAFRSKVEEVISQLEEEREAEEWSEELEGRQEEAVKAIAEYDELSDRVDQRLTKLRDSMFLDGRQLADMRSLVILQNDRNREMTRLWSGGDTPKEDLDRIFAENRAAHRAEVSALIGEDQLGAYRKYLREGGFGGRFSFFVGPWEGWRSGDAGGK